jgi:hypothetical protein
MNDIIKRLEDVALSNHDILKLLDNKVNIILYPDLHKYSSIDEILSPFDCCIILYEAKLKPHAYGHWCAIIKRGDIIEFFNPYGGLPDASLKLIDPIIRLKSNQFWPYLKMLMFKSPYELHYNEFQFQRKNNHVKSCGRHCVFRVMCRDINIYQYKYLLDQLCQKYDTDYDGVVTMLTSK